MEVEVASVSSIGALPRLRVSRNSHASFSGHSSSRGGQDRTPQFTSHFRHSPLYPDSQTTSEDELGMDTYGPNSRLMSASLPPADSSAPSSNDTTYRLKALLERFDNASRMPISLDRSNMPPSPPEPDSEVDILPSQSARASIRSLIDDALREPGDTPQKSLVKRRASFDASGSPKIDQGKRKSNSDDDPGGTSRRPDEQASSSAMSLDRLRVQFMESMPSVGDAAFGPSGTSELHDSSLKRSYQSSNLPVYHSPLQHVKSHKDLEPFSALRSEDGDNSPSKTIYKTGSIRSHRSHHQQDHSARSKSPSLVKSNGSDDGPRTPSMSPNLRPRSSSGQLQVERSNSGRVSPRAWPTPPPGSNPSRLRSVRRSHNSDRAGSNVYTEDGLSSRSDSTMSSGDYQDRVNEAEATHQHELERSWNRPVARSPPHSAHEHSSHHHADHRDDDVLSSRSSTPVTNDHRPQSRLPHNSGRNGWSKSHISSVVSSSGEEPGEYQRHNLRPSATISSESRCTSQTEWFAESTHRPRSRSPAASPHSSPPRSKPPASLPDHSSPRSMISREFTSNQKSRGHRDQSPTISPPSGTSNFGSIGRTSRLVDSRENDSDTRAAFTGDHIRGHRRTITEPSESVEPYRYSNGRSSSIVLPDPEESDGSMFGNGFNNRPQTSTPPRGVTEIPDFTISPIPSDIPLPSSPSPPPTPKRGSIARANADLARLQKAISPNFVFPPRHPSPPRPSTPVHSLETPPNHQTTSTGLSTQRQSPSASFELPELPNPSPPNEQEWRTPGRAEEQKMPLSTFKTPRPPGAFGTPYPTDKQAWRSEPITNAAFDDTMTGRSYATTPAPPGAYRPTPSTSRLKGILKVRFDGDHPQEGDALQASEATEPGQSRTTTPPSPSLEEVPLNDSPSRKQKLRMVDEYGRARRFREDGQEIALDRKAGQPQPSNIVDETTLTPRRRAKMRQVDAFGNEIVGSDMHDVEESKPKPESPDQGSVSKRKKSTYSRIAKSLEELQKEMAEEEKALSAVLPDDERPDNGRLVDLATVSKTARVERDKLVQKLQTESPSGGDLTNKFFIARNPRRLPLTQSKERGSWWQRKWRTALMIILLEIILLFMGYRLALVHAKHVWLMTYFDPFFPALYIHISRSAFLNKFASLPLDWTVFSISGRMTNAGVIGFILNIGRTVWEGLQGWRIAPWESWGNSAVGQPVPLVWPS